MSFTHPGATDVNDCWNRIGINGDSSCAELTKAIHCRNCPVYSEAGRSLLDRDASTEYRAEWTALLGRAKDTTQISSVSFVIFTLGKEQLALPTSIFREVTEARFVHRLPARRDRVLMGLVNVRGELQLCVSLGALLDIESDAETNARGHVLDGRMLVVEQGRDAWVFPVNKVHGTFRFDAASIGPVPATLRKSRSSFTRGAVEWEGKTVGCLDENALLAAVTGSIL